MADLGRRGRPEVSGWAVLAGVIVGCLIGGGVGAYTGLLFRSELVNEMPLSVGKKPSLPLPFLGWRDLGSDFTVLVMGVDATGAAGRQSFKANSDTNLLLRLASSEGKVYILSLPRDTHVRIRGHGTFKLNAAEAWGGPALAAQTIADFLDIAIHRYLVISLDGVVKAIDAIGGVDVSIPKPMHYDDWAGRLHIHFDSGTQHLTGQQVEGYLRFRKDDIGSDVARVQRQQAFLMETGRQFLTPAVVLKLPALWNVVRAHTQTNFTLPELLSVVSWARGLDMDRDVTMTLLPGEYSMIGGISYWTANVGGVSTFLDSHFREARPVDSWADSDAKPIRPRVVVWDATGKKPRLKALKRLLQEAGYAVWAVGHQRKTKEHTRVIVQRGNTDGGRELAKTLGIDEVFPAAVGDLNSDFTVELGEDWEGDLQSR